MRRLILYPFLFALSPVVFQFLFNAGRIPVVLGELALAALVVVAASIALWFGLSLILRSRAKAGLVVSLLVLYVFTFGTVLNALRYSPLSSRLILLLWTLVFGGAIWLVIRIRAELGSLTLALNIFAITLFVLNITSAPRAVAQLRRSIRAEVEWEIPKNSLSKIRAAPPDTTLPDIYYIIPDMYVRSDFMKSDFGYDNSEFLNYLTGKGFYVVPHSRTNYWATELSMSSTMNFTYLDSIADANEGNVPVYAMIQQSRLTQFLKRRGYTIIAFASEFRPIGAIDADVRIGEHLRLSLFQEALLSTTIIPSLASVFGAASQEELHRRMVLHTFNSIPRAAKGRHPAFVYAHIVCPHPPFVFGADGEPVKLNPVFRLDDRFSSEKWFAASYGAQAKYVSRLLQEMVDQILANSRVPPIIIIQSDHGPGYITWLHKATPRELVKRLANLIAVYLPQSAVRNPATPAFYDSMTSVNTVRLALSRVFDTTMAPLPDRSWFSAFKSHSLFFEVSPEGKADFSALFIPRPQYAQPPLDSMNPLLTVLAFPMLANEPGSPDAYARALARLKYPGKRVRIQRSFILPVHQRLSLAQAVELYHMYALANRVPYLSDHYESYEGPDPAGRPVVAFFFKVREPVR